jgi:hypothetical protein
MKSREWCATERIKNKYLRRHFIAKENLGANLTETDTIIMKKIASKYCSDRFM